MSDQQYDVIVIGAGAVGENVADRTVQGGLKTVIVEEELVGGECSYWACMPSKALLRAGATLQAARDVRGAAQAVTGGVDPTEVFARRTTITHDWDDGSQAEWLEGAGIDLVRGHARITGEKTVEVTGGDGETTVLTARHAVVVSTGSAALLPDTPGLKDVDPWTSREATSATEAPGSLAIIGGGVVGAEMATAYASFGTKVTLLSQGKILQNMEPFAAELVQDSLEKAGVEVRTGAKVTSASRADDGIRLEVEGGEAVTAERVLVAIGRTPRTEDLGLDAVGLKDGDWIEVDDTLRSPTVDWLYATGDVNHRALLTHQGKYQARAAGDAIVARATGKTVDDAPWGADVATADHSAVPQVTFTDPEIASVGLTKAAAEKAGLNIRVLDYDLANVNAASAISDHYVGQSRAIVDEDRKVIVGVTLVGPDIAELLMSATIAIVGEVPIDRLWHAVPAYPTMSEVWLRWLESYGRPGS